MLAAEEHYLSIQKEAFPNAELVINVQTGPCSQMSLAIYPSYEDAKKNWRGAKNTKPRTKMWSKTVFITKLI